ncbi:MAG: hypothetical protein JRF33_12130 [Deltaproteobacteria bacterium]|nr:hypothetical protein [Deltaproteobacteria bacterium]
MVSGSEVVDGLYTRAGSSIAFTAPAKGRYWISTDDVPIDADEPPLACMLGSTHRVRYPKTLEDVMSIGPSQEFDRAFNYNGRETSVAFHVQKADTFEIRSGTERGVRCELFRGVHGRMDRLSKSQPNAKQCVLDRHLPPGDYTLKLYGGNSGIETLRIHPRAAGKSPKKVTKNSCHFGAVKLEKKGKYRIRFNRTGRVTARGLVMRELPLRLNKVMPLVIDAKESLDLPIAGGAAVELRASGGADFFCGYGAKVTTRASDGLCRLPATQGKTNLRIENSSSESVVLSLARPKLRTKPAPLQSYDPAIQALPSIETAKLRFLDFDRKQSHSLVFDVAKAGLYHVTTEGLLATSCRLRTPIVTRLADNAGGGRGRNCLVSKYLRPGRYLLTVSTTGSSRGRAAVLVSPRPVKQELGLSGPGDVFLRVPAEVLVRQKIRIKKEGRYRLSTSGQNMRLQCRLEDEKGWPLLRVPSSCDQRLNLEPGELLWSHLPLTVESMRRTKLEFLTEKEMLRGNVTHAIKLNKPVEVELSADGKDEFLFELPAELSFSASLSRGMQGRIYPAGKGKTEVLGLIKPGGGSQRLKLAAGKYRLETEHSRADLGIRYKLELRVELLAPGLNRVLSVPGTSRVLVPERGVVRIGSEGESDVRCRLFDAENKLVAESEDLGADWNCLFAVPLPAGEYRLELEAQNKKSGNTLIRMRMPKVEEGNVLQDGQEMMLGQHVLLAGLPQPKQGHIQEVGFRSRLRFSCALEDAEGQVLQQHLDVLRCGFLVNPLGKEHKVRLWTRRWQGKIKTKMVARAIERFGSGRIAAGKVGLARIAHTGLYKTAKKIWCAPAEEAGPLNYCGGEASLVKGDHFFSTTGPRDRADVALKEVVAKLDRAPREDMWLGDELHLQRQFSSKPALHLFALRLPPGLPHPPACRLDGGLAQQTAEACYAVVGPVKESLAHWWLPGFGLRRAELERLAAVLPSRPQTLGFGLHSLLWKTSVARYVLPAQACRIELVMPHVSWAIRLDGKGQVTDFCPPTEGLSHCILGGAGGELLLVSDSERRARLRLLQVGEQVGRESLVDLVERWPQSSGRMRFAISAADHKRLLKVQGAQRCLLSLDDGSRKLACAQEVPPGKKAELIIDHGPGPLWALLSRPGTESATRWHHSPSALPPGVLTQAQAKGITGDGADYVIQVAAESLVSIKADQGLCSLWSAEALLAVDGGAGCDLRRMLAPGTYRIMLRSFADRPLSGEMLWTAQSLRRLSEGVGMEEWVAPGETRAFRFSTQAKGKLGLGLQAASDALHCKVYDHEQKLLGEGCHLFLDLLKGDFLMTVAAPSTGKPMRFRPVLLGLSGSREEIPDGYLRDFFRRVRGPFSGASFPTSRASYAARPKPRSVGVQRDGGGR